MTYPIDTEPLAPGFCRWAGSSRTCTCSPDNSRRKTSRARVESHDARAA
jgi:hypothetical protein